MTGRPRQNHSPTFKTKVAVAAVKGERTLIELAKDLDVHPDQIKQRRDQLPQSATGAFGVTSKAELVPVIDAKTLACQDRRVGAGERLLVRRAWKCGSVAEGKKMIDPTARQSVSRQAAMLGISRGGIHDKPRPVSDADLYPAVCRPVAAGSSEHGEVPCECRIGIRYPMTLRADQDAECCCPRHRFQDVITSPGS